MNGGFMSSRSEQYLARAEKCQQYADTARIPGTKRLYEVLAADRPDETGKAPVFEQTATRRQREAIPWPLGELMPYQGICRWRSSCIPSASVDGRLRDRFPSRPGQRFDGNPGCACGGRGERNDSLRCLLTVR